MATRLVLGTALPCLRLRSLRALRALPCLRLRSLRSLRALSFAFIALACEKRPADRGTDGTADAATSAVTAGHDSGSGADGDSGVAPDGVQPVYPIEANAPAVPLAQRLCSTLTEMPEKKRSACCSTTPGIVMTTECTRTLSAALRYKAVEIADAAVDACVAAFERTLDGCDWVGPFPPGPPAGCQGLVKGLIAEGKRCRSSLECSGTLRCAGVGPTSPGTCARAKAIGEVCGGTVDTLAALVRQNDIEGQHPECADGRCIKHRCAAPVAENGECQGTTDCETGLQCVGSSTPSPPKKGERSASKLCTRRAPPASGEPCAGGVCATDLQCISGKCASRKPGGAECTTDFECRGGCLRSDAGARGKCGPRCDVR